MHMLKSTRRATLSYIRWIRRPTLGWKRSQCTTLFNDNKPNFWVEKAFVSDLKFHIQGKCLLMWTTWWWNLGKNEMLTIEDIFNGEFLEPRWLDFGWIVISSVKVLLTTFLTWRISQLNLAQIFPITENISTFCSNWRIGWTLTQQIPTQRREFEEDGQKIQFLKIRKFGNIREIER